MNSDMSSVMPEKMPKLDALVQNLVLKVARAVPPGTGHRSAYLLN